MNPNHRRNRRGLFLIAAVVLLAGLETAAGESVRPLVLQELTWTDVEAYLKTCDMVIIPLGSTEQHGPHLPLGTDYYQALETCKRISARTGVLVAPVVLAGYSLYHSGFPGSLSLNPETLEQVLFETAEMLINYGFRKLMFFNFHGGNRTAEQNVIHRINHTTQAVAVAVGIGTPLVKEDEEPVAFDQHAGVEETSNMLYLAPELVRMERAEKPRITFSPQMAELRMLAARNPDLMMVWNALLAVPEETGKGGASRELSSNGVWTFGDPKNASRERGEKFIMGTVDNAVRFIEAWKRAKK